MGEKEELENLADALIKQGLAASYKDGIEKARQILGIKEVIDKKRRDFLNEKDQEVERAAQRMTSPPKQETRQEMVNHIKNEVAGLKREISSAASNPQPENVAFAKEKVEVIKEEVKVIEKEAAREKQEEQKKEHHEKKDKFSEEKKIDLSEVFNYGKR